MTAFHNKNISKHVQNHSSYIAKALARNRLASFSSTSSAALIHRSSSDDFSRTTEHEEAPYSYLNLLFLSCDILLAANDVGEIQAFRLDERCNSSESKRKTSRCSKMPIDRIGSSLSTQQHNRGAFHHLKALRNGEAFLSCTKTGDIQIYATERHFGTSFTQQSDLKGTKRRLFRHPTACLHDRMDANINNNFYKIPEWNTINVRPINYYFFNNNNIHIDNIFLSDGISSQKPSIGTTFKQFLSQQHQCTMMDSFEYQSTVIVAVVDPDFDCFYVQHLSNSKSSSLSSQSNTRLLCIPIVAPNEYITSICFLSQTTILTSHVTITGSSTLNQKFINRLKEWDLRKISNNPNESLYEPTKIYCYLQTFPLEDNIVQPTSMRQYDYVNGISEGEGQWIPNCPSTDTRGDDWVIVNIQGPSFKASSQHVIVTSCNFSQISLGCCSSRTAFLDQRKSIVNYLEHNSLLRPSATAIPRFIIPSFTPDMELMGCFDSCTRQYYPGATENTWTDDDSDSDLHTFLIFDISKRRSSIPSSSISEKDQFNHGYSRKRSRRTNNQNSNASILAKFETKLLDQYGLASNPNCIAVNPIGSNFVCGTVDGDIFMFGNS